MLAVYLAPFYVLVNLYLLHWIFIWVGALYPLLASAPVRIVLGVLYAGAALAMLPGFLLPKGRLRSTSQTVGNYWLGISLYLCLTVAVADLARLGLSHVQFIDQQRLHSLPMLRACGAVCLALIVILGVGGAVNAKYLHTTRYSVTVQKSGGALDGVRVVLAADLHLGSNVGCAQMRRMVARINACRPDLVVFAGDIFDNDYDALRDDARLASILRGIHSRYGVYACYGNHDIAEKILAGFTFGGSEAKVSDPRMDAFLRQANICLLRDEGVLIADSFYLYGRPDAERPGRGIAQRKTPREITAALDPQKPLFVLDHQPGELAELAAAGVDVDLCGHTHGGQMFPANLVTAIKWENPCGYLQKGAMHNIVTSGVGLFGPNMRVGSRAEICDITVQFRA
jgi:hypothetical protein